MGVITQVSTSGLSNLFYMALYHSQTRHHMLKLLCFGDGLQMCISYCTPFQFVNLGFYISKHWYL